ncbi:MAG: hypothetical protein HYU39_07955 [Thaumarchaeota archaeon]|nr:hypothetical protein [Nitrososphaerota archaeon]
METAGSDETPLALEILTDAENKLLERREVEAVFKGLSGKLTRNNAVETIASNLKVNAKQVHLVTLLPSAGLRSVKGLFYVYSKEAEAKEHLPKYLSLRMLPKEERQKVAAAEKAKAEAKPAEKPAKPAGKAPEKPAEKPAAKAEAKPEAKAETKAEPKPAAKPAAKESK